MKNIMENKVPNDDSEEKNPYQQVLDLPDNELFVKGISDLPQDKPLNIDEAMDLLIETLKRDILKKGSKL